MSSQMENQYGNIAIDNAVIAKYAGACAIECFGIVGMASVNMRDGFVRLLKRGNLSHGVKVTTDGDKLAIDFHIIVAYGVSVATVADNLVHNVKYKVEEFTGMKVGKINVYVEGVRIID